MPNEKHIITITEAKDGDGQVVYTQTVENLNIKAVIAAVNQTAPLLRLRAERSDKGKPKARPEATE